MSEYKLIEYNPQSIETNENKHQEQIVPTCRNRYDMSDFFVFGAFGNVNLRRWQRASEKRNYFSGRWTKSVHFGSKTGLKKHQKRAKNGQFCKIDRLLLQITQNYDDIKRKNAIYRWTLFGLFKSTCFRYHNTRQVATRQEHNNMDQRSARQTAMRQTPNEADSEPVERHLRGFLHGACGFKPLWATAAPCRSSIWQCSYGSRLSRSFFGRSLP